MKKITFKTLLFCCFTLCSLGIAAQDAPPSDDIFRLKNVETGLFLTDTGSSATAVTMTDTGEPVSTHFTFVQSGAFYNIDSEVLGILRAPGSGGPGGPYVVVSTTVASPATDADKVWTIQHNQTDNTYRFQSGNSGRYLYHDANGTVTHVVVADTDDRSNWELIPFVEIPVEIAPDEDTNPDLSCPASGEFQNDNTRNVDLPNPVNVGTADDRSCYSDYSESNVYGKTWGVYNITDGSNHWDGSTLQPRIERSLPRSGETGVGSYARFTGVVRILEVGDGGSFSQDGSYLIQAKGKHTGGGGSNDPAICLYLAKPVYGTGINADKQVAFDIYAERILYRGGEGSGREVVFLKQVNKNEEIDFELEVGFRVDPNDATQKIHYCDAVIGGETFNWNIPEPERGTESGIRYGAYRVRGGRAQFRWANTTYEKVEVVDNSGPAPSDDVFRFRNVATGQFLTDAEASAMPVTMTDSGEPQNTHWTFVQQGALVNIDSEVNGILRAPGSGGPGGPYVVLSTGTTTSSSDKVWTLHYNETDETYRFESGTSGRFMYHEINGQVTHIPVADTDMRSVWEAIPTSQSLSIEDNELTVASIKVYPNPANSNFIITVNNSIDAYITIYNMLGKVVYNGATTNGKIEIRNNRNLTSGLYLVRATTDDNKTIQTKLIIN
ncbi:T9SS type A sorting domain-containing protein [Winogradskyella litoriviva]|uniref:T9SS type A sorting domain-containing protein n=1 Tax=Winogradskyella litoriviva TaxID=1220182 RepID=A0ABX2E4Q4_9FLAO|nr:T9SS type A sorting domain-containing protein [Winogradskyella litoriviva]NRD23062.1 T9SS type A sorting domain-containing protein [Winogradskyella litoriviva]